MTVYQIRKSVTSRVKVPGSNQMVTRDEATLLPTIYGSFNVALSHKPKDVVREDYKEVYSVLAQNVVME